MTKRSSVGGGDMLYGVREIATHLGIKPRQAMHLVETDRLPVFRTGRVICGRRSTLDTWLDAQEAATAAARRDVCGSKP